MTAYRLKVILVKRYQHLIFRAFFLSNSETVFRYFSQYPSIHTNYIIPHCTTLQYNHNI